MDRIFTRIGASDDLAGGRSTFMVEMTETATILNNATPQSLVLMDEIGRGTSTFDGLSLAWAAAHFMGATARAFTLFATHYFELTSLADELPGCSNAHLDATEHAGELVFLHAVKPGTRQSELRTAGRRSGGRAAQRHSESPDLSRRSGGSATRAQHAQPQRQLDFAAPPAALEADALREALADADPDALSPRAALELLYRLKALADD